MANRRNKDSAVFRIKNGRLISCPTKKISVRFFCNQCKCWSRTINVRSVRRCAFCLLPLAKGFCL